MNLRGRSTSLTSNKKNFIYLCCLGTARKSEEEDDGTVRQLSEVALRVDNAMLRLLLST